MERKIGEIFTYEGKTYQVIEANACRDCAFKVRLCKALELITGTCIPGERTDNANVSFKLINNMEIKNNQLIIDIPEGMEVDVEHSDLSKGIIKFRNDNIILEDIYKDDNTDYAMNLIILSENKFFNKLLCIAKLIDIANYYNKGWKPDFCNDKEDKYYIGYSKRLNKYDINLSVLCTYSFIYFKNKEDAQAVINNPNFRDILDAIYKN